VRACHKSCATSLTDQQRYTALLAVQLGQAKPGWAATEQAMKRAALQAFPAAAAGQLETGTIWRDDRAHQELQLLLEDSRRLSVKLQEERSAGQRQKILAAKIRAKQQIRKTVLK
jgi:hypothetical protein